MSTAGSIRKKHQAQANTPARDDKKQASTSSTDDFYDEVVHAGSDEPDSDAYDKLTRVDGVDTERDVVDNLDPATLLASLERAHGDNAEVEAADVDDQALEQSNDVEGELRPDDPQAEDDDGNVSPEELGEQFLRAAAQQERRTKADDTEPNADVDLLSDEVHQASLFDHNHDPLDNPRFPHIAADETAANADHRRARAAAKRAASGRAPKPER